MRTRSDFLGRDGYTWWVGEVESNQDPSNLVGVKVRILGWYTGSHDKETYTKEIPTVHYLGQVYYYLLIKHKLKT
ncbi:MAG: hypothetical protein CM15mV7_0440 [uncultured marine virus]|nr:MAG: hypothetical protein CM15mV7_0440 [uncultured marine virus]